MPRRKLSKTPAQLFIVHDKNSLVNTSSVDFPAECDFCNANPSEYPVLVIAYDDDSPEGLLMIQICENCAGLYFHMFHHFQEDIVSGKWKTKCEADGTPEFMDGIPTCNLILK